MFNRYQLGIFRIKDCIFKNRILAELESRLGSKLDIQFEIPGWVRLLTITKPWGALYHPRSQIWLARNAGYWVLFHEIWHLMDFKSKISAGFSPWIPILGSILAMILGYGIIGLILVGIALVALGLRILVEHQANRFGWENLSQLISNFCLRCIKLLKCSEPERNPIYPDGRSLNLWNS